MANANEMVNTWKLKSNPNMTIEFDGTYFWMVSCKGTRNQLVNRLDSFVTSYQLSILREIGVSEQYAK